jgi:hypothetical protein
LDIIKLGLSLHANYSLQPPKILKMFRTALLRSARSATSQVVRRSGAIARPVAQSSFIIKPRFAPSIFQAARCYSAAAGLQKSEVEGRIVDLLKNFDKVCFCWRRERACTDGYLQVSDPSKVRYKQNMYYVHGTDS